MPYVLPCLLLMLLTACEAEKHVQIEPVQVKTVVHQGLVDADQVSAEQSHQAKENTSAVVKKRWGKKSFFQFMKPIVERENKRVMVLREHLLSWQKHHDYNESVLKDIAQRYRVQWSGKADGRFWREILDRVDEVPAALVLVQAANESSWGNSRFARQGNNYFGQWCFTKGCGLVPLRRNAGASHEVKSFASVDLSVRAYIHNLNTSDAYTLLRNLRHSLRRQDKPLDAIFLAIGLKDYSERGMDYVRTIQSMIRSNKHLIDSI